MGRYLNHVDFNLFYLSLLLLISLNQFNSVASSNDTTTTGLSSSSSSSPSTVKYLPGFSGPLPFHLETGFVSFIFIYSCWGVVFLYNQFCDIFTVTVLIICMFVVIIVNRYISVSSGNEDFPSNTNDGDEDIELFYYFVKSERKPEEDPLIFWFSGGPRCSSLTGLAFEIGPINIEIDGYVGGLPKLVLNRDSWTKIANINFPDAPVYTGFSYSKSSPNLYIGDKGSSKSSYEFVIKWLNEHPEFKSNPLYIGGDSYAGKIVPVVVQYLINDIETQKYPFLNLKGYLLGNPISNRQLETNAGVPYAFGMGLLSYELFESMKENCKGKYINFDLDNLNCLKDRQKFQECTSNINPPHISEDKYCGNLKQKPKQPIHNTRRSLSANAGVIASSEPLLPIPGCREAIKKWIRCNIDVPYKKDVLSSVEYHKNISTKLGYRALIYSGDHDFMVPHVSTEAWIRSLNLSIIDDWRPWLLDDQFAGYTRTYASGLTYATVKGAGHTAPEFRPKECYAMFERWISHAPL
ncbi:hypothetical protein MKW98_030127 [Papaver atlanticum]|uniref:Uncharacterized protein n=1 Tax=Papaver atlanticum TaxID=357466 RepID=A0AAD4T570_9MAGN|nr:hypothetical protein MKW98_030127 [Papaver atlanticum]